MIFWLILILGGGDQALHVGNFGSAAACEAAAKKAMLVTSNPAANPPYLGFVCVQANESTTRAPG